MKFSGNAFQLGMGFFLLLGQMVVAYDSYNGPADCGVCLINCVAGECNLCLHFCHKKNGLEDSGTLSEGLMLYPPRNNSHHLLNNKDDTPALDSGCPYTSTDATDLMDTLNTMVNSFYANNAQKITMRSDGGFGLRMLYGQLDHILEGWQKKVSPERISFLKQIQKSAGALGVQILEQAIAAQESHTRRHVSNIIKKNPGVLNGLPAWRGFPAITRHFEEFQNIGNEKEVVQPSIDFQCLTTMISECDAPQICKAFYLRDIYSQYMLMHQILFQHFAERKSCTVSNPEMFGTPEHVQEYRDRLCSKAYLEAEYLESKGFPTRFIDLFAEQVGFCGVMGYPNFMRDDWLHQILSWREGTVSGCMPDLYGALKTTDVTIQVPVEGREDGKTEEECLVHLSSVSLMALAMNLRYMVDTCEPSIFNEYFHDHA